MDSPQGQQEVFKDINDVINCLGGYGRFQLLVNIILCMIMLPVFPHIYIMYFLALDPPWKCVANSTVCTFNQTMTRDNNERCSMPRSHWEYTVPDDYSIITQYDIYCQHQWMNYLSTSMLFLSWGIGSIICGYIADNYGRRIVVITSFIMIIVCCFCLSFSPNIIVFSVIRFIMGFFMHGATFQTVVCMSELTTAKYRAISVAFVAFGGAISLCVLGVKAYFIRKWKHLLIAMSVPYVIFVPLVFFLPETITWLYVHKRKDDLTKILSRVSYWNKKPMPERFVLVYPVGEISANKLNILDIFRPRKVLLITSLLGFAWLAIIMNNNALYLAANDLGESLYLNYILLAIIDLPGSYLARMLSDKWGRKPTVIISMVFTGLLCMAIAFIPSSGNINVIRVIFGMVGKLLLGITLNGLLVWTLELYPTQIRSQGVGFTQLMSRIGAVCAPWIAKGLRPFYHGLPFLTMGGPVLIVGILLLILPETKAVSAVVPASEEIAVSPVILNINATNI